MSNDIDVEKTQEETGIEQSGLRQLMNNLDMMVQCYQGIASRKAREVWMAAFAIEVSMVSLKLMAMRKRWQLFLPFHEVIDVHFGNELATVKSWLPVLGEDVDEDAEYEYEELILDNGYLLDLMGLELEPIKGGLKPDELKQAVEDYCKKVDKLLKKSDLSNWEATAMNQLEQNMQELVQQLNTKDAYRMACVSAIRGLANELHELEEYFWSDLKEEQFMVLAVRLMHRDCKAAIKNAHDQVRKEHNSWPKKFEKDRAVAMKDRVKMVLMKEAKGEELREYIDLDYPDLLSDACFGQFLFKNRHELTTEDVQIMVHCCTMIEDLNKFIDPNLSIKKRRDAAMGRELDNEEKIIVKRLLLLADKAEWRGGATADSIKLGINRMLGVNYHLDTEMKALSDELWKLLKVRKNCDADKSLMVTWLNIVGYCVRTRILSGGSPALCKLFFPKCGQDDYKAIDKGKAGQPVAFKKVEALLEKFLK